jgi:two-component system KDP operon response regulator KdpE
MSPELYDILIATRDPVLRQLLRNCLIPSGHLLADAHSTQDALDMIRQRRFDVILLDTELPEYGGVDACQRLRGLAPHLGIVVVCRMARSGEELLVLEAGADDCMVAPFRFREILARIGAVLRRTNIGTASSNSLLRTDSLEIDRERRLFRRDGVEIHLSPREFDLLTFLMVNAGRVMTHAKLLGSVWAGGARHDRVYLRTYIKSLRQKIEEDPANPRYILTQPWVGYRFRGPLR